MTNAPTPQPHLRRWVPVAIVLGVLLVGGGIVLLPTLLSLVPVPSLAGLLEPEQAAPVTTTLPKEFARNALTYGRPEPIAPAQPPVATRVSPSPTPPATPVQASVLGGLNPLGWWDTTKPSPTPPKPAEKAPVAGAQTAGTPKQEPKAPTKWVLIPTDITLKPTASTTAKLDTESGTEPRLPKGQAKALAREGEASQLIKPATWARPSRPDLTLYRSQAIPCVTTEAINSDLPGTTVVRTPIPVFDKVGAGQEILPKGTLIVTKQVGKTEYGQRRLHITLEQIEFPGPLGVVWGMKGDVGDSNGANGVPGPVNNHLWQLAGAVAINAVLSLGTSALAGTPSGFYQNPAQRAAQEAAQSTSSDIRGIAEKQLKVPPTIEPPQGTICTIHLNDNVTFSKSPTLVR